MVRCIEVVVGGYDAMGVCLMGSVQGGGDAFEATGMHTRRQCAPEPLLGRLKCWSANEAEGVYWVRVRVCRCRIGGGGRVGEGVTSSSRFCEVAKDEGEVMVRAHHLRHREVDKGVALAVVS